MLVCLAQVFQIWLFLIKFIFHSIFFHLNMAQILILVSYSNLKVSILLQNVYFIILGCLQSDVLSVQNLVFSLQLLEIF